MRVFIISTTNMGPELRGGLIGVTGPIRLSGPQKRECVEELSRYVAEGWAIAADPTTVVGRIAALTAEAACVPFVALQIHRDQPIDLAPRQTQAPTRELS